MNDYMTIQEAIEILNPENFDMYNDEVQDKALDLAVRYIKSWNTVVELIEEVTNGKKQFKERNEID